MAPNFILVALLIVIVCNVCPTYSEYSENNLHHKYGTIKNVSTTKTLNKSINAHAESLREEFSSFTAANLFPVLIDVLRNNGSDKCSNDSSYVLKSIASQWSLKMLDSFGKPEKALMQGNNHWIGEFDECLEVYAPLKENSSMGDFHGQYCNLQITAHHYGKSLPIIIGVCLPDSCESSDIIIIDIVNTTLQKLIPRANITEIKLTCNPVFKKFTPAAICVIFLLSIFILLALIGSSITAYKKFAKIDTSGFDEKKPASVHGDIDMKSTLEDDNIPIERKTRLPTWIEKVNPFYNCFCFFTNGAKLLDTNSEGQLPCLHGIRFLSMCWVIYCHTYAFGVKVIREMQSILPKVDYWPFQIIMSGYYSVNSFYVLSGFLLTYLFFEGASKNNGKIPWLYFYVHRYLRLTPVYMIVLAFYATIFPYLSTGPLWTTNKIDPNCGKYWWRNLLYINNFADGTELCVPWSWYLSTDMQFFVISPLFLIALWRYPLVGFAILAFFLNATTFVNFVLSYQYQLPGGMGNIFTQEDTQKFLQTMGTDYFNMIYVKPYTRISPYLVGIALAYYLYKRKKNNNSKNSLIFLSAGWFIASTVTLACVFGLYHRHMSDLELSMYNAFKHTCYALGLGWVMFVCLTGQAGLVNSILSFQLFIPLSRLTYCAYLVHLIVMELYFNSMRSLLDFSHLTMMVLNMGFLVASYSVAFITSLLFESPIIRLEKLARSRHGTK